MHFYSIQKQPSETLVVLDKFDEAWTRGVLIYWARLLRGKTLAALDRPDEAKGVLSALEIVPSAQSPRIGTMAIEAKRGHASMAEAISRTSARRPILSMTPGGSTRTATCGFPTWENYREMASK
jgi:hypothetical protein